VPKIRLPRYERFMPPLCVVTGATEGIVWKEILVSDGKTHLGPSLTHTGEALKLVAEGMLNASYGRTPVHLELPFTEAGYRAVRRSRLLHGVSMYLAGLSLFCGLGALSTLLRNPMPFVPVVVVAAALIPGLTYLLRRGRSIEVVDGDGPEVVLRIPSEAAACALEAEWAEREKTRRARVAARAEK
jgi:hypothetical protein